jgi:hypothetical protein
MLVVDGDEYEEVFPLDRFYVARFQSDATNVPTGAWFQKVPTPPSSKLFFGINLLKKNPDFAHALFSLERRIRVHFSQPECQLVIGTIITALALPTVRYIVLTQDFLLSAVPPASPDMSKCRSQVFEYDDDDSSSSSSSECNNDGGGFENNGRDRSEERRVNEWARLAEERAVLPFLECEILKRRRSLHPDYDTSKTYFVRPFGIVMDIIARMDVTLQQGTSARTWWRQDD